MCALQRACVMSCELPRRHSLAWRSITFPSATQVITAVIVLLPLGALLAAVGWSVLLSKRGGAGGAGGHNAVGKVTIGHTDVEPVGFLAQVRAVASPLAHATVVRLPAVCAVLPCRLTRRFAHAWLRWCAVSCGSRPRERVRRPAAAADGGVDRLGHAGGHRVRCRPAGAGPRTAGDAVADATARASCHWLACFAAFHGFSTCRVWMLYGCGLRSVYPPFQALLQAVVRLSFLSPVVFSSFRCVCALCVTLIVITMHVWDLLWAMNATLLSSSRITIRKNVHEPHHMVQSLQYKFGRPQCHLQRTIMQGLPSAVIRW